MLIAAYRVMKNELLLNLVRPMSSVLTILVPINFLILFALFAIGGAKVPVGLVAGQTGTDGQQLATAIEHSITYRVQRIPSSMTGSALIHGHHTVATIQIPDTFTKQLQAKQRATVNLTVNNLNSDFANDIRRGMPLVLYQFDNANYPHKLPITYKEVDSYPKTVSFLSFLSVSIQTVALLIGGLLFGGRGTAREWEKGTIKELMLAPISPWSVVIGKLSAGMVSGMASAVLVFIVLLLFGVHPMAWGELTAVFFVTLFVFVSLGVAIGSLVKSQFIVIPLSFALGLPLFFLSGAFGPIAWGTPVAADIASIFPVLYANVIFQHAIEGYWTTNLSPVIIWGILLLWAVVALVISSIAYRRATVSH